MRFLKNKIQRSLELAERRSQSEKHSQPSETPPPLPQKISSFQEKSPINPCNKRRIAAGNNVMKNYCRALINFAESPMVIPYIINEAENGISEERFVRILSSKKKNANCIKGLRCLLLEDRRDSKETRAWKKMFQKSCEVFLKFFCVNWIYNSKVNDQLKHLSYRSKLLRRIKDPKHFTHLEDVVK